MKKLKIKGKSDYNIYIQKDSFNKIEDLLRIYKFEQIIVIADANIDEEYYKHLNKKIKVFKVPIKEEHKNFVFLLEILKIFEQCNLKKESSLVLALGGGVLLDSVGFASSIYLRGIKVAYVPTTLLAMVDASVGSKNSLHYAKKKNLVGTYYDPVFVLIDSSFLKTLNKREIKSGIAEIIKIAYLMNPKIISLLDNIYDYDYIWDPIIYESVVLKNKIVQKDYSEKHVRKYLNFGHTFGHAIEAYYKFEKYTHGEAVAIGMCLAYPSKELIKLLKKYNLPVCLEGTANYKELYELMKYDKKNEKENKITYITLKEKVVPTMSQMEDEAELLSRMERVRIINDELLQN